MSISSNSGDVERAVDDRAGQRGARLRLDAALEAAEDDHVAGLQVRRAGRKKTVCLLLEL